MPPGVAIGLLDLPLELRESIYVYLDKYDIENLSVCSKQCFSSVKHLFWREFSIDWCNVKDFFDEKLENFEHREKLKFTTHLSFNDNYQDDYLPRPRKWTNIATSYKNILKLCRRVNSLHVEALIADNGLKQTCDILKGLEELKLEDCKYITNIGWKRVTETSSLRSLSLVRCRILANGLKTLAKAQQLRYLCLVDCKNICDIGMQTMSVMTNLEKLTISHNHRVTGTGVKHLGNLTKLTGLSLECTAMGDDGVTWICNSLPSLKTLSVESCYELTDDALDELSGFTSLEEIHLRNLDISDYALKEYCENAGVKESVKIGRMVFTKNKALWPKSGSHRASYVRYMRS